MRTALFLAGLLVGCSDYDLHRPDKAEEEPEEEEPVVEEEEEEHPDIELSPTSLEFGYLPKDCVTEWTPVTISNVGAADLEVSLAAVEAAGGTVVQPIFAFPGGRRFGFEDPSGNRLAVWSTP